ncbi:putative U3 small nucleolar RNA-associated protein 11 [Calycina marina]|uniref:U3 small nucleolar RNA-associated protein 11 n=1 Tax=Calycina marina TaxID=1763456 RepID=A0A9P7ZCE9_9HELO|nr:putative U3 small nucleolar RNA-associated protein 11 [Calycina marina]
MSSMRNAIQRRNHRERGQPEERAKWGLLEKHKDYSARARDFNVKKAKLKALKQKAAEKNPDEFYHGMLSTSGPAARGKNRTGTINGDRGNQVLSTEAVRLFKTQDLGYVRTARNVAAKEVEALEKKVLGRRRDGKKIVFVDGVEEQIGKLVGNEKASEYDEEDVPAETKEAKKLRKLQELAAEKLEARLDAARERLSVLNEAEAALDLQRAKMSKSPTVGGVNKNGVKFKVRERKR